MILAYEDGSYSSGVFLLFVKINSHTFSNVFSSKLSPLDLHTMFGFESSE
jgi:hypothetical protein